MRHPNAMRQHMVAGRMATKLVQFARRGGWDSFTDGGAAASKQVTILLQAVSPRSDNPEKGPEPPTG